MVSIYQNSPQYPLSFSLFIFFLHVYSNMALLRGLETGPYQQKPCNTFVISKGRKGRFRRNAWTYFLWTIWWLCFTFTHNNIFRKLYWEKSTNDKSSFKDLHEQIWQTTRLEEFCLKSLKAILKHSGLIKFWNLSTQVFKKHFRKKQSIFWEANFNPVKC